MVNEISGCGYKKNQNKQPNNASAGKTLETDMRITKSIEAEDDKHCFDMIQKENSCVAQF